MVLILKLKEMHNATITLDSVRYMCKSIPEGRRINPSKHYKTVDGNSSMAGKPAEIIQPTGLEPATPSNARLILLLGIKT